MKQTNKQTKNKQCRTNSEHVASLRGTLREAYACLRGALKTMVFAHARGWPPERLCFFSTTNKLRCSHGITLHTYIHHITRHYITLHHIRSQPITSHYITLHHTTSHDITLHYIICHYMHYMTTYITYIACMHAYIALHYVTTYIHT